MWRRIGQPQRERSAGATLQQLNDFAIWPQSARITLTYLDGSLAGPQIVVNVGAVAVKATPLRGRLQAEP